MSIDYGHKRIGLAVTDPLQIIATGLDTVPRSEIFEYLKNYLALEDVDCFVVGEPFHDDGRPAQITSEINEFMEKLKKAFPDILIERQDESYSSRLAEQTIRAVVPSRKKRRDKRLVDKVAAVIILQDYMERVRNRKP